MAADAAASPGQTFRDELIATAVSAHRLDIALWGAVCGHVQTLYMRKSWDVCMVCLYFVCVCAWTYTWYICLLVYVHIDENV